MKATPLSLIGFTIDGLFGALSHDVELRGNATLIFGANGSGKTTTLLVVERVLRHEFSGLYGLPFSQITLRFSDQTSVVVRKVERRRTKKDPSLFELESDVKPHIYTDFHISLRGTGEKNLDKKAVVDIEKYEFIKNRLIRTTTAVAKYFPGYYRVGQRTWRDPSTGKDFEHEELAVIAAEKEAIELPKWFIEKTTQIKIGSIRAQRLFAFERQMVRGEETGEIREIVSMISDDMKKRVNAKLSESALNFQGKEKTFPHRILAASGTAENEADLRKKYIELQERLKDLQEVGLQESGESLVLPEVKLNPTHRRVLSLYLNDLNEKLDVFNSLSAQIRLLCGLIEKKFKRKNFSIDKSGFKIRSTDSNQTKLKPNELSSGEQHQLVMLYELIFSEEEGQLYLIDEPEISLHVEWQRQFLSDMERIAEVRGHKFIIATHSPQVINGNMALTVGLDDSQADA
ncbi:AAA family ATPase [Xanthomonas campestris]|jgi:predicted ATPase|uniref:AAA family ATPase n=1 Tax=Xanthomonas campestris TaxID=339 RepID=UPI000E328A84|nr:AAA family ATPase [Xanthomonas campestris]MEA9491547.1 AAA family ATPase [Xanthomonas campestris]MEA9510133.1 AAA family ATPase [Xanthomonas campestris]MEA9577111.1 AAA family ATPase [Xanthomonas campestris]MEB2113302.1 AAA family ATPase [Xanthomonas campestris pv. campestris]RFF68706.1 hypothetical protein D0A39_21240 [Xanthomonas campestris pv. campestris]